MKGVNRNSLSKPNMTSRRSQFYQRHRQPVWPGYFLQAIKTWIPMSFFDGNQYADIYADHFCIISLRHPHCKPHQPNGFTKGHFSSSQTIGYGLADITLI